MQQSEKRGGIWLACGSVLIALITVAAALLSAPRTAPVQTVTVVSRTNPAATAPVIIDLNAADLDELRSLDGIGAVLAQRIIDYREAHGPLRSADDLLAVDGIGPATIDAIRDRVKT